MVETRKQARATVARPKISLTNPAREFIDHEVDGSDHRAFSPVESIPRSTALDLQSKAQPSENRARVSGKPTIVDEEVITVYKDTDIQQKLFVDVLEKFEKELPEKYKTQFDIRGKHDWNEVIAEAKIAEIKYRKKASNESPFGKVRSCFRSLQSRNLEQFAGFIALIPFQDSYSSILAGGFKIIVKAANRMDEIRQSVFVALALIPEEVEKSQLVVEFNKDMPISTRLHKKMAEMFVSILNVLRHIVTWLEKNSARRHLKAFFGQESYEEDLQARIDTFKNLVLLVKEEASICAQQRSQQMSQNIDALKDQMTRITFLAEDQSQDRTALLDAMNAVRLETINAIKPLYDLLRSHPNLDPRTGQMLQPDQRAQQRLSTRKERKPMKRVDLMDALDHDPDLLEEDLSKTLKWCNALSPKDQDRAVHIIQHSKLKGWLLSSMNSALLIDTNQSDLTSSSIYPSSFISAHLANSAAATKNMAVCYWFAGLHRNTRRDPFASVGSLVRSFICQLLAQYADFDLYFVKRRHVRAMRAPFRGHDDDEDEDEFDDEERLEVLCNTLDELIAQLPEYTVLFLIIDNPALLEVSLGTRRNEVEYLVARLLQTTASTKPQDNKVKFLINNAGGTFRAGRLFELNEKLVLPETINGDSTGFSKLLWRAKVGNKVGLLGEVKEAERRRSRSRSRRRKSKKDESDDSER